MRDLLTDPGAKAAIWALSAAATAGVLIRPFKLPEAVWAVAGAVLVLALGLMPWTAGLAAVAKGTDVYLFLAGMMLLSETARREGLFDWLAAFAVNRARGSPTRLFAWVYVVGVVVTTFFSNDATAVVLTPAVYAAAQKARAKPLPYLFICALIANAASFVLPISNPANLVLYGDHVPALGPWLHSFALPSLLSILATYALLRWIQRGALQGECAVQVEVPTLTQGARMAMIGLLATAIALTTVSSLDGSLGWPTCALGLLTALGVCVRERSSPWPLVKGITWSVLPLVAGLFVLVEALQATGLVALLAGWLDDAVHRSPTEAAGVAGLLLAFGSNLVNNLPAGLLASSTLGASHPPQVVTDALLIAVDLGPNLSITGSLATILWLAVLRREGESVGFWAFLRVGALVMVPALLLSLGARLLLG